MRLTKKLLSFLNRVFDKDPSQFLALRLRYVTGSMTWRVQDARLTTVVTSGPGVNLDVDLAAFRIGELINHLAAQPGYEVVYGDASELSLLSARALLDGEGDIQLSNGDHLHGYTSALYAYLEPLASELHQVEVQIQQALLQMSTRTASDIWLDELGGYYGIPRLQNEFDASYGPRIIAEVLRPRGNNVAMEMAIKEFTGQDSKVTDVVLYGDVIPLYNNTIIHDSEWLYNATNAPLYGLFDVEYGYDLLNGADVAEFTAVVRDLIQRLRDAGTHLRALSLTGSKLEDVFTNPPTDAASMGLVADMPLEDAGPVPEDAVAADVGISGALGDTAAAGADSSNVNYVFDHAYTGLRSYDGKILHRGGFIYYGGTLETEYDGTPQKVTPEAADALHHIMHVVLPTLNTDPFQMAVDELDQLVNVTLPSPNYW